MDSDFSLNSWKQKTPRQRHCIISAWPDEEKEFHKILIKLMRAALELDAKALDFYSLTKKQEEAGADFLQLRPEWTGGELKCWALCPGARLLSDEQGPFLLQKWGSKRTRKDYLHHAKTPRGLLLRYGRTPKWCDLLSICFIAMEINWATHIDVEMIAEVPAPLKVRAMKTQSRNERRARLARSEKALKDLAPPALQAHSQTLQASQRAALEPIQCTKDDHEHLWILGTFLHISPKARAPRSKSEPLSCPRHRICWACGQRN